MFKVFVDRIIQRCCYCCWNSRTVGVRLAQSSHWLDECRLRTFGKISSTCNLYDFCHANLSNCYNYGIAAEFVNFILDKSFVLFNTQYIMNRKRNGYQIWIKKNCELFVYSTLLSWKWTMNCLSILCCEVVICVRYCYICLDNGNCSRTRCFSTWQHGCASYAGWACSIMQVFSLHSFHSNVYFCNRSINIETKIVWSHYPLSMLERFLMQLW